MWILKLGICAIVLVAIQASGDETPNERNINEDLQLAEETGTAPALTEPATLLTEEEATYVYKCSGPLSAYSHARCALTANNRVCYYQDTLYKYQSCAADCNGIRHGSSYEERCNSYPVCAGYLKNNCDLELENPPTKSTTTTTTTPRTPTTGSERSKTEAKKTGSPKTSTEEGAGEDVKKQPISDGVIVAIVVSLVVGVVVVLVVVLLLGKCHRRKRRNRNDAQRGESNLLNSAGIELGNLERPDNQHWRSTPATEVTCHAFQPTQDEVNLKEEEESFTTDSGIIA